METTTTAQYLQYPWDRKTWGEVKRKITENVATVAALDSRISSMLGGRLHPRSIVTLMDAYFTDDAGKNFHVTKAHFEQNILPCLQQLIHEAPKIFKGVKLPLLAADMTTNVALTRKQVATLLAAVFLGCFNYDHTAAIHSSSEIRRKKPKNNGPAKYGDYPDLQSAIANIFTSKNMFALQCLMEYFYRVHEALHSSEDVLNLFNATNIVVKRTHFAAEDLPKYALDETPIAEIAIGEGCIHDSPVKMHVVAAHSLMGGDGFCNSLTAEETLLLVRPESLVAMLLAMETKYSESIAVFGAEKVVQYAGYGSSLRVIGRSTYQPPLGFSENNREAMLQQVSVFIDASPRTSGVAQFIEDFERDLDKAYCGFAAIKFTGVERVAAAHWTYGFNGNNMQLKFLQLLIACSLSGKSLVYYPNGKEFEERLISFVEWLQGSSYKVRDLFRMYVEIIKEHKEIPHVKMSELDLFDRMVYI